MLPHLLSFVCTIEIATTPMTFFPSAPLLPCFLRAPQRAAHHPLRMKETGQILFPPDSWLLTRCFLKALASKMLALPLQNPVASLLKQPFSYYDSVANSIIGVAF